MRRLALLTLLTIAVAAPLRADRGQSYFTYDDGGTVVRQAEDGREMNARVNLPVFPGDEVITSRSGRAEIRLSDGNVIALDRATDVRFRSILDSYEGSASQTIVELRYGHVMVQRTEIGREFVRVDTEAASYLATEQAIYAIESNRGADRIVVFDGSVEVRTPQRTSRVRAGQEARADGQGVFGVTDQSYAGGDDFERWYLRRAERYGRASSRYLDSSLAYADADLSAYGSWTYVAGYGTWAWRPRVSVGWRPYFYGEWVYGLGGCLVWTSYEPWGWVPYHYGRWAYDPIYGWVWLPGAGYSPAWVYWAYGPDYIGWAPAGYWDCYQPYYNWGYHHYGHHGWDSYWGVHGRVRPGDMDPRPWTFLSPNHIIGQRVDRIAFTADAVRDRLRRGGAGANDYVTISTTPARFSRGEMRDPATTVNNIVNRGFVTGGTPTGDISSFIRRDADLSKSVRDRIVRTAPPVESARTGGSVSPIGGGGIAPITGGGLAPIGSSASDGRVYRGDNGSRGTTVDRGGVAPVTPSSGGTGGVVRRGDTPAAGGSTPARGGTVDRGSTNDRGNVDHMVTVTPSWRDVGGKEGGTVRRGDGTTPRQTTGSGSTDTSRSSSPGWRERVQRPEAPSSGTTRQEQQPTNSGDFRNRPAAGGGESARPTESRGSDVPRRVIDSIGGARVRPSDGGRASTPPPQGSGPTHVDRSAPSSPPPSHAAPSSPPPSSPPPQSNSGSSSKGSDSGSRVHRDQ